MFLSRHHCLPRKPFIDFDYARTLPEAYVKKAKREVPVKVWDNNRFGAPPVTRWAVHPRDQIPSRNRPWEREEFEKVVYREFEYAAITGNSKKFAKFRHSQVKRMPDDQWTFFPGDIVEILVGKDKGRQGTVSRVCRETNELYVDGLHTKLIAELDEKTSKRMDVDEVFSWKEQPLSVEKNHVKLVDPNDNQPCTAHWKLNNAGDEWIRVSDRTGFEIPVPSQAQVTYDYVQAGKYLEVEAKDTTMDDALKITYRPKLKSFEDEISDALGIKDLRQRKPTYWY